MHEFDSGSTGRTLKQSPSKLSMRLGELCVQPRSIPRRDKAISEVHVEPSQRARSEQVPRVYIPNQLHLISQTKRTPYRYNVIPSSNKLQKQQNATATKGFVKKQRLDIRLPQSLPWSDHLEPAALPWHPTFMSRRLPVYKCNKKTGMPWHQLLRHTSEPFATRSPEEYDVRPCSLSRCS